LKRIGLTEYAKKFYAGENRKSEPLTEAEFLAWKQGGGFTRELTKEEIEYLRGIGEGITYSEIIARESEKKK